MDFVGKRRWFFILSALIIIPGLISLAIPPGLHLGIDFTGGSTISTKFKTPVSEKDVRQKLNLLGHPEATIQQANSTDYFIRTSQLAGPDLQKGTLSEEALILQALDLLGERAGTEVELVAGVIANDTRNSAVIIVFLASIAILLFITYAFRSVPSPFRYGAAAIVALVHDLLIVLGIFSILGKLIHLEVNTMFIIGMLFVIGYSVNDTIVVFDRIRENIVRVPSRPLQITINNSILESLGRSLATSLTLLFTILALLLLGGESIREFLIVLLISVVSGTYSSICIASQFLIVWEKGEGRLFLRSLPFFPRKSES